MTDLSNLDTTNIKGEDDLGTPGSMDGALMLVLYEGTKYVYKWSETDYQWEMLSEYEDPEAKNQLAESQAVDAFSPLLGTSLLSKGEVKAASTDPWACSSCTFLNPSSRATCEICETPAVGGGGVWACGVCTVNNPAGESKCSVCNTPNPNASGPTTIETKSLAGKRVALYFSAHWCPPCRAFTPHLATYYKTLKPDDLDIVFVSWDRDESKFNEYYASMPWKALPFGASKEGLNERYNVRGIPSLIVLGANGEVETTDGRAMVMNALRNQ
jgi:nucleoredoxin